MKAQIVFAHGNGFPGRTCRMIFEHWRAHGHTAHVIDRLGRGQSTHGPSRRTPASADQAGCSRGAWLADRLGPDAVARRRHRQWPSREAAHAHFAVKPLFARWHPQVLRDHTEANMHNGLPAGLLAGRDSQEMRQCGWGHSRSVFGQNLIVVDGDPLFPMQHPLATAQRVLDLLAQSHAPH